MNRITLMNEFLVRLGRGRVSLRSDTRSAAACAEPRLAARFHTRRRPARVWPFALVIPFLIPPSSAHAQTTVALPRPLGQSGTLSFRFETPRRYRNGAGVEKSVSPVLEIAGVADMFIQETSSSVALTWRWQQGPRFAARIPELPGPEPWFFQITWNAAKGRYDVFLNGVALTTPGTAYEPWTVAGGAAQVQLPSGSIVVSEVALSDTYLDPGAARRQTPYELRGKHADLFGKGRQPAALDVSGRLGRQLVAIPMAEEDDVQDWVMEGPGKRSFGDGWMRMWSTRPDAEGDTNGHIVFWCPRDFPSRFVCEWEVQILSDDGLAIIFFAAKGQHGEDIFDPSLPPRDGTFSHYIRGAVNSYHISYYADTPPLPARTMSNLRKNNKFYLLTTGPVAIPAGSKDIHHMRLIKDGPHIQLQCDGKVSIDYTDPGSNRYGPVYEDGKIGLRQMQWTVARYRNLRIWELNE